MADDMPALAGSALWSTAMSRLSRFTLSEAVQAERPKATRETKKALLYFKFDLPDQESFLGYVKMAAQTRQKRKRPAEAGRSLEGMVSAQIRSGIP